MVFSIEVVECRVLSNNALHLILGFPRADGDQVSPVHETEVAHDGVGTVKQVSQIAEEAVLTASNNDIY